MSNELDLQNCEKQLYDLFTQKFFTAKLDPKTHKIYEGTS